MRLIDSIKLIEAGYAAAKAMMDKKTNDLSVIPNPSLFKHGMNQGGVQAFITPGNIVVVPGTNETQDWLLFNSMSKISLTGLKTERGASNTVRWHEGFLEHAKTVYQFVENTIGETKAKGLVGHSLGGASGQIVGASLGVETHVFGSPACKYGSEAFKNENLVHCIERTQDAVPLILRPVTGYRHLGTRYKLRGPFHPWLRHKPKFYRALIEDTSVMTKAGIPAAIQ